jgi:hypothetical protein
VVYWQLFQASYGFKYFFIGETVMIISRIMGGLGNQMFQYALGRRLALERDGVLKLDLSWFDVQEKRKFELNQFNIDIAVAQKDYIRELIPFSSIRLVRGLWRRIDNKLPNNGGLVYKEKQNGFFDPQVLHVGKNKYISGYWPGEKYFKAVEEKIRSDFTLREPLSDFDQSLAEEMASNPYSVSVHVRRGDYVSDHMVIRSNYVCTPDYYNETMRFITERLGGKAIFYIFSDDPEWCGKGLEYPSDYKIVSNNTRNSASELVLMSHCRNVIIANSSFSWWGAWLIDHPDKIVVHPKIWFYHHPAPDIPAEGWISYQHDTKNDWKYIDIPYGKSRYREQYGREFNLEKPETFSEKLQWLKIYDRNPIYNLVCDKYAVRSYVADRIGEQYLTNLYGVYQSSREINWEALPNQFVLKANHGSNWNIFCKNKRKLNIELASREVDDWMTRNFYYHGREWIYKDISPKIICEEYLEGEKETGLADYKFYCFNERIEFIQVDVNRHTNHKRAIFDIDWNLLPFNIIYKLPDIEIPRPPQLEEMIEITNAFVKGFPFIRVDLYLVHDRIYFGELTICTAAGFPDLIPPEYDFILGKKLELPHKKVL